MPASVALVALFRHGSRPRVEPEPVGFWRWIDVKCRDINELRTLLTTPDLERHVVRLRLDMAVSLSEENEVERILRDLQGTDATHGRAGILLVDRTNLRLQPGSDGIFPDDLPPVVKDTIARLDHIIEAAEDEAEKVAGDSRARAPLQAASEPRGRVGARRDEDPPARREGLCGDSRGGHRVRPRLERPVRPERSWKVDVGGRHPTGAAASSHLDAH